MRSIAPKRRYMWLLVVSMGSLPAICFPSMACLSGAEQECIQLQWFQTGSSLAQGVLADLAPRDVAGDGGWLDAIWNGGVDWALGLARQAADTCYCRTSVAPCIPDDPFPFPDTQTPGCCN